MEIEKFKFSQTERDTIQNLLSEILKKKHGSDVDVELKSINFQAKPKELKNYESCVIVIGKDGKMRCR